MDTYQVTTVTTDSINVAMLGFWAALYVVAIVIAVVAMWKLFVKAGEAGWKALIPFYNTYTMFRIAGRNGWWFLLLGVPLVNFVLLIVLAIDLAKHFGKSTLFGIFGLVVFPYVGYLMLAFGDAKYVGPKHD
jgi:hypothetical protein